MTLYFFKNHTLLPLMLIFGDQNGVVIFGCLLKTNHSAGFSCLKHNYRGEVLHSDCDENGHFICLVLKCFSVIFVVVNIYGIIVNLTMTVIMFSEGKA